MEDTQFTEKKNEPVLMPAYWVKIWPRVEHRSRLEILTVNMSFWTLKDTGFCLKYQKLIILMSIILRATVL